MHSLLCILYVVKLKLYKKWNKCLQLDYLLSQSIFLRVETVCCSVHTHDQSLCRILLCHYLCRTGCALDDFLHSHWAQKWKQDNKNMKGVTMYAFEVFKTGMKNLIVRWRWLKARLALKTFSAGQCKSMQMSSQLLAYHVFRKVWLDLLNIHVQTRILIGWNSSGTNYTQISVKKYTNKNPIKSSKAGARSLRSISLSVHVSLQPKYKMDISDDSTPSGFIAGIRYICFFFFKGQGGGGGG